MPSRSPAADFFPLRFSPNSLLRLSALKGATFRSFPAEVSTNLKVLWILPLVVLVSATTSRGLSGIGFASLGTLLVWVRNFREEAVT